MLAHPSALVESRFRAMGTDVHVAVVGAPPSLLELAEERIRELEGRWSRFLDTSEISVLNQRAGRPVIVSQDTVDLLVRAVAAWQATAGRYDPTVGSALAALGYDRSFAALGDGPRATPPAAHPTPGPAGIEVIPEIGSITLPAGVSIDPGGIGKGLAADLVAQLLVDDGADGALVNVGGDLRAIGRAPTAGGWSIAVDDPLDARRELLRLAIPGGAVATSSRLVRRWLTTSGEAHHLLDPTTGRPADTDVVAVTVVAGEAWWAEALTKALFLAGRAGLRDLDGVHGVVVTSDGSRHATPDLEATLR